MQGVICGSYKLTLVNARIDIRSNAVEISWATGRVSPLQWRMYETYVTKSSVELDDRNPYLKLVGFHILHDLTIDHTFQGL